MDISVPSVVPHRSCCGPIYCLCYLSLTLVIILNTGDIYCSLTTSNCDLHFKHSFDDFSYCINEKVSEIDDLDAWVSYNSHTVKIFSRALSTLDFIRRKSKYFSANKVKKLYFSLIFTIVIYNQCFIQHFVDSRPTLYKICCIILCFGVRLQLHVLLFVLYLCKLNYPYIIW